MPDYLSKKDWRSVLDKKEHKAVKKTGVSELLEEWASAQKKDELGRMVSALERIIEKAGEVKTAQKAYPLLVDFLAKMIDAAKSEERKLAPRLAQVAEDGDEEGDDSDLGKSLRKIRQLAEDKAWNFVIVPGKPSSGFVVSKKSIKKSHMDQAFEMKGKRGPFFTGRIFGEAGKYVLDLGETAPVPGLAKAAKNAALLHAEMTIKVLVRGGGVELDGDTDIDPPEDDTGLFAPRPSPETTPEQFHEQRIAQLKLAVDRIAQTPGGTQEGAMDGIFGAASRIRSQIEGDGELDGNQQKLLLGKLASVLSAANEVTKRGQPDPTKAYPDDAFWEKAAEQIVRLDPSKHDEAWKRFMARLDEFTDKVDKDTALSPAQREQVEDVLNRAMKRAESALNLATRMHTTEIDREVEKNDPKLFARLEALDRKVDTIQRAGLPTDRTARPFQAVAALRRAFGERKLDVVRGSIDKVEQAIEQLLKEALQTIQTKRSREDQAELHKNLAPAIGLIKKAAFPPGLVTDPNAVREAIKKDPLLLKLIEAGSAVTKKQDDQTIGAVELAARDLLKAIARREQAGTPLPSDGESRRMANEALKRASMARMALQYETLGAPPWDDEKTDQASELQAQLFFLESALAQGVNEGLPDYLAPQLDPGDEGGASGSWWIKRTEPGKSGTDPKATREYIFKPAKREAAVLSGLPPGSGAPREMLAKKLDDVMAGAGFNVGVSPTTLATLDSAQLGGDMDPTEGPQLGSMQKMAPNEGPLGETFGRGDMSVAQNLDKRSFDDVAVFDMIYANLDRHSKNILVEKDPITGKYKVIPIDHGSALPDPENLEANRGSLSSDFNVMADPNVTVSQEPLGPETLDALGRLDPDEMLRQMRQARDDMEKRHGSTKGMVDDSALEAAAARVRFIKEVGGSVPVAVLFDMLRFAARRIAECKPGDVKKLAEELKAEAARRADASKDFDGIKEAFEQTGGNRSAGIQNLLRELGWAWSLDTKSIDPWIQDNPVLVTRILKTRMPNPAAQTEMNRLLPAARKVDPQIDDKVKSMSLGHALEKVFEAANKGIQSRKPSKDVPDTEHLSGAEAFKQEFQRLGDVAELERGLKVLPNGLPYDAPKMPKDGERDYNKMLYDYWSGRVTYLKQWIAFRDEGGLPELLRLGGMVVREMNFWAAYMRLRELKTSQKATSDVMALKPEEVVRKTAEAYKAMTEEVDRLALIVKEAETLNKAQRFKTEAVRIWDVEKNAPKGLTVMTNARDVLRIQKGTEDAAYVVMDRMEQELAERLKNADENVRRVYEKDRLRLEKAFADARSIAKLPPFRRAMQEALAIIEDAELGDASPANAYRKQIAQMQQRIDGHKNRPWHRGTTTLLAKMQAHVDDFTAGTREAQETAVMVGKRVDVADKLLAVLRDVSMDQLDEETAKSVVEWDRRLETGFSLDQIDRFCKTLSEKLSQNVK